MIIEQLYLVNKQPLFVLITSGENGKRKKRTRLKLDGNIRFLVKRNFNLGKFKDHSVMIHYKNL